jgi:D-alanine-D-alanine ligase
MARATRGFVPVLHAATDDRPDEIDTRNAAEAVEGALQRLGYATEIIALDLDLTPLEVLARRRPLSVFNLVDAVRGDTRLAPMVPAVLEGLGLPFTGARSSAWLGTLSKIATKRTLVSHELPTPAWSEDGTGLDPETRVIVKPVFEHGSLGLDASSVVRGAAAAQAITERALRWSTEHFAESYIEGREFNLALLERDGAVEMLPIAEILFEGFAAAEPRIVGYDAKWAPESAAYICTPRRFGLERDEPALAAKLVELARACWSCFSLTGYARVDFRVDGAGAPFILEVNVNPCLSPDAGFAAAAAEARLAYEAMIGRIVESTARVLPATA